MIEAITLKELSESMGSLERIGTSLKAGKMKYRFAKVIKWAKAENELVINQLGEHAKDFGAKVPTEGQFSFALDESEKDDPVKIKDQAERIENFNRRANTFLKTEKVQPPFDAQYFTWEEFEKAEPSDTKEKSNASDLANLLWLVSDEGMDKESPSEGRKMAAAGA
jgi:hypothetical protein